MRFDILPRWREVLGAGIPVHKPQTPRFADLGFADLGRTAFGGVLRNGLKHILCLTLIGPVGSLVSCAHAGPRTLDEKSEIEPFVAEASARHALDKNWVRELLREARVRGDILEAIARPAERKPWHEYRKIFITGRRIDQGLAFWREHEDTLRAAEKEYGVPAEIIVAIIGVESFYGRHRGRHQVIDALSTLAFRYPPRSRFFRSELIQYLLLIREEDIDPQATPGSYAGAMGIPQFIPSSYRRYAVDFDGNGKRDLIGSPADAIGSVGSYLSRHGWRPGEVVARPASVRGEEYRPLLDRGTKPHTRVTEMVEFGVRMEGSALSDSSRGALVELEAKSGMRYWVTGKNFYAITRYNHSNLYAMAVHQLARAIAKRYQS